MKRRFDIESLYLKMPIIFQNILVSIEGNRLKKRRYDNKYQSIFEKVVNNSKLQDRDLVVYHNTKIKDILNEANQSSYWAKIFHSHGVNLIASDMVSEIQKLPILTKMVVKDELMNIRPRCYSTNELIQCHTSGTTGSGLNFWQTKQAEMEQWAIWWRYRGWHGINHESYCGYFGGRSLVPLKQSKPPYWRVNSSGKQLMFSAYHLSEKTAKVYIDALKKYNIEWLHGYPSILALLSGYMLDQKIKAIESIRIITTGAESLLPQQKTIIEKAFCVPVRQHYGQAEAVANFSECENGNLHVDEDFSFVEFIPVNNSKNEYRIIGTNYSNPAFPLIRYDTGDIATLSSEHCLCGRTGRIVSQIDGRKEDYVLLPNGVRIGRLDHIFKDLIHVREAQIYQFDQSGITIRVVKGKEYDNLGEEKRLLIEAKKRLGNELDITIEYVDSIPKTRTGKLRLVVSELKI